MTSAQSPTIASSTESAESMFEDTESADKPRPLPPTPRLRPKTLNTSSLSSPPATSLSPSPPKQATSDTDIAQSTHQPRVSVTNESTTKPKTPSAKARSTAHLLAALAAQSTPFRALQDAVMQGRALEWQIEQYWELAEDLDAREAERVKKENEEEEYEALSRETLLGDDGVGMTDTRRTTGGTGKSCEAEEGELVEEHEDGMIAPPRSRDRAGRIRRRSSSAGMMDRWYQSYLRGEFPGGEVDEVTHLPWPGPDMASLTEDSGRAGSSDQSAAAADDDDDAGEETDTERQTRRSASPELESPSRGRESGRTSGHIDGGDDDDAGEDWVATDEEDDLYDTHRRKRRATGGRLVQTIKLKTKLRSKLRSGSDSDAEADQAECSISGGETSCSSHGHSRSKSGSRTRHRLGLSGLTAEGQLPENEEADDQREVIQSVDGDVVRDVVMRGADARGWRAEDAVEDMVLSERVKKGYRFVD